MNSIFSFEVAVVTDRSDFYIIHLGLCLSKNSFAVQVAYSYIFLQRKTGCVFKLSCLFEAMNVCERIAVTNVHDCVCELVYVHV